MPATLTERADQLRTGAAAQAGRNERSLSIVVPVYNEGAGLPKLHAKLTDVINRLRAARGLTCEIIYIDDGSRDDSFAVAKSLPAGNFDVQVVSLSRNDSTAGKSGRAGRCAIPIPICRRPLRAGVGGGAGCYRQPRRIWDRWTARKSAPPGLVIGEGMYAKARSYSGSANASAPPAPS